MTTRRITILDYGAGNLHSLVKALDGCADEIIIEPDPVRAIDADALLLPGVGAFAPAAALLAPARTVIRDALLAGLPTVGICLGMQLLFDSSAEGSGSGLGIFSGRVERLRAARVPQMGWNDLTDVSDLLLREATLELGYFANSFVCRPTDEQCVTAWSEYEGVRFPAMVRSGRVMGCQFHPEKSSRCGVRFLRAALSTGGQA